MHRSLVGLLLAATVLAVASPAALAGPGSGPPAYMSLGDSFISGEAGRWRGNSEWILGDHHGTDLAYDHGEINRAQVYGSSGSCHRALNSEIDQATPAGMLSFNLACSGAETNNVLSARGGGEIFKGQAPQSDVLWMMARDLDVKGVVVSIGGNDFGFSKIIQNCALAYWTPKVERFTYCKDTEDAVVRDRAPEVLERVKEVLEDIKQSMEYAGYQAGSYRLILQTYPSPVPDGDDMRMPEYGLARSTYGCGMWNRDLTWARRTLVPRIAQTLRSAATAAGAELVDMQDLLSGHEVCAEGVSDTGYQPWAEREWVRVINTDFSPLRQGDKQESLHPNALGQIAMGACMRQVLAAAAALEWRCTSSASGPPQQVTATVVHPRT